MHRWTSARAPKSGAKWPQSGATRHSGNLRSAPRTTRSPTGCTRPERTRRQPADVDATSGKRSVNGEVGPESIGQGAQSSYEARPGTPARFRGGHLDEAD